TRPSKRLQIAFTGITVTALVAVVVAGMLAGDAPAQALTAAATPPQEGLASMLGLGMVYVLLTYGGWNESAYLSGELRDPARNVSRVLLIGTAVVTGIYLLANLALLDMFGLQGLRQASAVGADVMRIAAGPHAAILLSLLVCCTALSTINGTILTGARVYVALGADVPALRRLGAWSPRGQAPVAALLAQGAITLALVAFGAMTENGVQAMVAYTAPVFWFFM